MRVNREQSSTYAKIITQFLLLVNYFFRHFRVFFLQEAELSVVQPLPPQIHYSQAVQDFLVLGVLQDLITQSDEEINLLYQTKREDRKSVV